MTRLINILFLFTFFFFITSNENVYAQKSRKSNKKVIARKENGRISSKSVKYRTPKKKVAAIRTLPNRTTIKHKGINYYYANNRFYTYSGGRYIVMAPKAGFRIKTLPMGYIKIKHPNNNRFWFNGVFYIHVDNEYEVVEPEIGTVIYELPADHERVEVDGNSYYEFENVLYEKIQIDGTRAYEVVGLIEQ